LNDSLDVPHRTAVIAPCPAVTGALTIRGALAAGVYYARLVAPKGQFTQRVAYEK